MDFNIIKRYLILADREIFDRVDCPMDPEHGRLFAQQTLEDKVYLYCIFCSYKKYPGYNTLREMHLKVMEEDLLSDLRHSYGLE